MRRHLRYLLSVVLLLVLSGHCFSQRFLALDKGGRVKRLHFYEGEELTFKTDDYHHFISGTINKLEDSTLVINGIRYSLKEITRIRVYRSGGGSSLISAGATMLPVAAAFLLGIETVNSLINDYHPVIPQDNLKLPVALLVLAPICYRLSYRNFTINENHPLKILDVSLK